MSKKYYFAYESNNYYGDCDYMCNECMDKGALTSFCCRTKCGLLEICKYCSLVDYYQNLKS